MPSRVKIELPTYITTPYFDLLDECDPCSQEQYFDNVTLMLQALNKCELRRKALIKIIEVYNQGLWFGSFYH